MAIVNQKGGVGKTTSAVILGHGLALQGWRVLLVDGDSQGHVERSLNIAKEPGLRRWAYEGEPLASCLVQARDNLWVLPGDKTTSLAAGKLRDEPLGVVTFGQRLRAEAGELAMDAVVMDMGPGLDHLQIAAMLAADVILIPVPPRYMDVDGVQEVIRTLSELTNVGDRRPRQVIILPTLYSRVRAESQLRLREMVDTLGNLVWPPIPDDPRVPESPGRGKTLWEYAPDARAIRGIALADGQLVGGYAEALRRLDEKLREAQHG
jgi:chromosome partitioning protein